MSAPETVAEYIARRHLEGTAFAKIVAAAEANDWVVKIKSDNWSYGWLELGRRSKKATVFFDGMGRVTSATKQTGSYGGGFFPAKGKAESVVAYLNS